MSMCGECAPPRQPGRGVPLGILVSWSAEEHPKGTPANSTSHTVMQSVAPGTGTAPAVKCLPAASTLAPGEQKGPRRWPWSGSGKEQEFTEILPVPRSLVQAAESALQCLPGHFCACPVTRAGCSARPGLSWHLGPSVECSVKYFSTHCLWRQCKIITHTCQG